MDFLLEEVRDGIYASIHTHPFSLGWDHDVPIPLRIFESVNSYIDFLQVLLWER